jgi:hypothetical protein
MTAPMKTPKSPSAFAAQFPGGDAFLPPDVTEAVTDLVAKASQNAQAWQTEMTGFMTRRFERDRLTWARLGECRTPMDLARVQQDWFSEAMEAYLDESRRLAALIMDAASRKPDPTDAA